MKQYYGVWPTTRFEVDEIPQSLFIQVQAIDESNRKRAPREEFLGPMLSEEFVASLSVDMSLGLERVKHGWNRIDSDYHSGRSKKRQRRAPIDTNLDRSLGSKQAVQSFEPNQVVVSRHPQVRKAHMGLWQVRIESQRLPIIQCCLLVLAAYAVGFRDCKMIVGAVGLWRTITLRQSEVDSWTIFAGRIGHSLYLFRRIVAKQVGRIIAYLSHDLGLQAF